MSAAAEALPRARPAEGRHCEAQDAGNLNHSVGCYVKQGRGCQTCDALKYYRQFGRLLVAYHAALEHEAACGPSALRYGWFLRVRTDLLGTPRHLARWPVYRARLRPETVYTGGFWRHGPHADAWTPTDMFGLVPRSLAGRVFSLALRFFECQLREINQRTCGGTWDWATPECIFKVHLSRCVGLANVLTTNGLSVPKGIEKNATALAAETRH